MKVKIKGYEGASFSCAFEERDTTSSLGFLGNNLVSDIVNGTLAGSWIRYKYKGFFFKRDQNWCAEFTS